MENLNKYCLGGVMQNYEVFTLYLGMTRISYSRTWLSAEEI